MGINNYLESIEIVCGDNYLNDKEVLETITNYSPRNFYELKLYYVRIILSEELEEFFINWKSRIQQISISFIFDVSSNLEIPDEIMKVIEKYQKIGTIKNFERLD